jgi:intracellular sulfur oxidation DsrE/DsrF family protein
MRYLKSPAMLTTLLLFWLGLSMGLVAAAEEGQDDKPFAEHHVVLQISDADPDKQTLVLNVANNLLKYYGPDLIALEIVAFGPGLRLLLADNANLERIDGLAADGVRFSACENTIKAFTKALGKAPKLNPHAIPVTAGVVRIIDLVGKGYVLIKP